VAYAWTLFHVRSRAIRRSASTLLVILKPLGVTARRAWLSRIGLPRSASANVNENASSSVAAPVRRPKLSATAYIDDSDTFAECLERALARSGAKVIEHRPDDCDAAWPSAAHHHCPPHRRAKAGRRERSELWVAELPEGGAPQGKGEVWAIWKHLGPEWHHAEAI